MAMDIGKRLSAKAGKPIAVETISVVASNRMQFLQQGQIDLMIATMNDKPDRRKAVGITLPNYYASGVAVMAKKDAGIKGWADLKGKNICTIQGAWYNKDWGDKHGANLIAFPGRPEAEKALLDGRCVGWLYDDTAFGSLMVLTPTSGRTSDRDTRGRRGALGDRRAFRRPDRTVGQVRGRNNRRLAGIGNADDAREEMGPAAEPVAEGHVGECKCQASGLRRQRPAISRQLRSPVGAGTPNRVFIDRGSAVLRECLRIGSDGSMKRTESISRSSTIRSTRGNSRAASGPRSSSRSPASSRARSSASSAPGCSNRSCVWTRRLVQAYIQFFRNTPPLVQLYFFYFALDAALAGVDGRGQPSWAAWAGRSCRFRSSPAPSTSRSSAQASRRCRRRRSRRRNRSATRARSIYRHVVLPLAFRVTLPALNNNLVNLVKTTTLAYAIAVPETLYMANADLVGQHQCAGDDERRASSCTWSWWASWSG